MEKRKSVVEIVFTLFALFVFVKLIPMFVQNMYVAILIFFIIIGLPAFLIVAFKKSRRKKFFESKNSLEDLRRLKPAEFEEFIAHLFQKMGFVTDVVGGSNDGGIDVIAKKDGEKYYIQCKKFITQQVSVGAMRDFYGAVVDKMENSKAYFITTNVFTLEAENFAMGKPIELIDGKKLMEYVKLSGLDVVIPNRPVFGSDVTEKCPSCGSELVLRTAKKGANSGHNFYGCSNYPTCRFIKNIN